MSSSSAGRAAVLLGALAVLSLPAVVAAAQILEGIALLRALYAGVPAALLLGTAALAASRRARFAVARAVDPRGLGTLRLGRVLAWAGLWGGLTGGVALGVYWALRIAE